MGKFKKVLAAYDGSEASRNALEQAVALVRASDGAELIVTVVMHMPEVGVEVISLNEARAAVDEAGARMAGEAVALAGKLGADARSVTRRGTPYEEITSLAEEEGVDLIVTGRRGMGRFERAIIGSVTARIIGHTGIDVLVVPKDGKLAFDKVLAATDASECGANAVARAIDFAASYKVPDLHMVSVVDMGDEFMALAPDMVDKQMEGYRKEHGLAGARAEEAGIRVTSSIVTSGAARGILDEAGKAGASLIVLGTHGRSAIMRLLMGSVTERVIGSSPIPVFVTHRS